MSAKYRSLTAEEKAALAELLRPRSGSLPFGDPVHVFNTLLYVLWARKPIRGSHGPGYAHSSKLSMAIRYWWTEEPEQLKKAWRTYLRLQSASRFRQWLERFDEYAVSWQDPDEAKKQAGKVHSLWFRNMHDVVKREHARRKAKTVK